MFGFCRSNHIEGNFANFGDVFGDSLRICQSFTCQLLVTSIEVELIFSKAYFSNCKLACDSPKFPPSKVFLISPLQSFPLYSIRIHLNAFICTVVPYFVFDYYLIHSPSLVLSLVTFSFFDCSV